MYINFRGGGEKRGESDVNKSTERKSRGKERGRKNKEGREVEGEERGGRMRIEEGGAE
jgi:hypothetical protein